MIIYWANGILTDGPWGICLDCSVVEHMTRGAGVPGLILGPTISFHLYFFVYVHSSHQYYIGAMAFLEQAFLFDKSRHGELVFVMCILEGNDFVKGEECGSSG